MGMTAISLFSGAGGMDIGVAAAGFDIRACVELDRHCCSTLRENVRRSRAATAILEGDIRKVDPLAVLQQAGLSRGPDLLFGGPPCQAFSQIGKLGSLNDDRGQLLFQISRYAVALRPEAIMVEQVKGLLSARDLNGVKGGVFKNFLGDLESLGYRVAWKIILAADYGVAQLRQRVFTVARLGRSDFSFPAPLRQPANPQGSLSGLPPYRVVGEAISGLPEPVAKGEAVPDNSHYDVTPARDRERIHGVPEGRNLSSQTHLPESQIRGLTKKDTTKFLRVSRDKPANTLRGGEIFYHPIEDRYLTPREYMRIHGYPDSYVLRGPIRGRTGTVRDLDQHRQVGNSVPPPVAQAIAEKIRNFL